MDRDKMYKQKETWLCLLSVLIGRYDVMTDEEEAESSISSKKNCTD